MKKLRIRGLSPLLIISLLILITIILATLFASKIAPYNPDELDVVNKLSGISKEHLFGTDKVGRDIFSRALFGGRTTMLSGLAVVVISIIIGIPIGLYAGYYGGLLDRIVSSIWNIILSFPSMLLAFVLMAVLGKGIHAGILALGIVYTPMISRLARSLVAVEKNKTYVEAERVLGASDTRIIFIHILPNCIVTLMAELTLDLAYAILDLAGLSFLGLGVQPPQSDWGYMLSDAQQFITSNPLQALVPGILIIVSVVSLNVVSIEITDIIESRYKSSGELSEKKKNILGNFIQSYLKHGFVPANREVKLSSKGKVSRKAQVADEG